MHGRSAGAAIFVAALSVVVVVAFAALYAFGQDETSNLPVETTLDGNDEAVGFAGGDSFLDLIRKGRWLMIPIILCSIFGLAFVFERLLFLRRKKHMRQDFYSRIKEMANIGKVEEALQICSENKTTLSRLLRSVLLCDGGARAEMEASLEAEGGRVTWDLRRNGKALGIIANIAPLLGLLGTVLGMIRAFETYAVASGGAPRPELLAVGIYEALITTAAGLTVAIPSLFFYHYFRGKADNMVREMEEFGLDIMHTLLRRRKEEAESAGAAN